MWLLSPLSWLLLAVFAALLAGRLRRGRSRRRAWRGCVLVAMLASIAMTPVFANTLLRWLEHQRPAPAFCRNAEPDVAVVLTAGMDAPPHDGDDIFVLGISSRRRVERAVEWWRQRPGRSLVMAGGRQFAGHVPESRLMAQYARRLGGAAVRPRIEDRSMTTWESARHLAALRPPLPRRVVLITSALHLPRARYAMTQAGFEVCGVGTDVRATAFALPGAVIPQRSALEQSELGLHELVGLLYYRWLRLTTAG